MPVQPNSRTGRTLAGNRYRRPLIEECYEQNYLQFRSLNQIMWQIPVLAMTLTGGLWFGVSHLQDSSWLRLFLLLTACFGNLALWVALHRFRHVMDCYLTWLRNADPKGFVDADVEPVTKNEFLKWATRGKRVRQMFSLMLLWGALVSFGFAVGSSVGMMTLKSREKVAIAAYYDQHAITLADSYESITFEAAYPHLVEHFSGNPLTVLDVGAGTGRDAAWLAARGHTVFAAEPSSGMRKIARKLHEASEIIWSDAALPALQASEFRSGMFDVVLMNAVWMHVLPEDREAAIRRLHELLKLDGRLCVSMRIGPDEQKRGFYAQTPSDFVRLAERTGFSLISQHQSDDLLGRSDVHWVSFELLKK